MNRRVPVAWRRRAGWVANRYRARRGGAAQHGMCRDLEYCRCAGRSRTSKTRLKLPTREEIVELAAEIEEAQLVKEDVTDEETEESIVRYVRQILDVDENDEERIADIRDHVHQVLSDTIREDEAHYGNIDADIRAVADKEDGDYYATIRSARPPLKLVRAVHLPSRLVQKYKNTARQFLKDDSDAISSISDEEMIDLLGKQLAALTSLQLSATQIRFNIERVVDSPGFVDSVEHLAKRNKVGFDGFVFRKEVNTLIENELRRMIIADPEMVVDHVNAKIRRRSSPTRRTGGRGQKCKS